VLLLLILMLIWLGQVLTQRCLQALDEVISAVGHLSAALL